MTSCFAFLGFPWPRLQRRTLPAAPGVPRLSASPSNDEQPSFPHSLLPRGTVSTDPACHLPAQPKICVRRHSLATCFCEEVAAQRGQGRGAHADSTCGTIHGRRPFREGVAGRLVAEGSHRTSELYSFSRLQLYGSGGRFETRRTKGGGPAERRATEAQHTP